MDSPSGVNRRNKYRSGRVEGRIQDGQGGASSWRRAHEDMSVADIDVKCDDSCVDAGGDARPHQYRCECLPCCVCLVCDVHDRSVVASIPLPSA